MELRTERVQLETRKHSVVGTITLSCLQRLADVLNRGASDFLAISDVACTSKADGSQTTHSFLALPREQIVLALPLEDSSSYFRKPA